MAQPSEVARIGVLVLGNPDPAPFVKGLRDGLARSRIHRGTEHFSSSCARRRATPTSSRRSRRNSSLSKVDVIVAFQTPAATAAKQATREIPIVMNVGRPGRHRSRCEPGAAGRQRHRRERRRRRARRQESGTDPRGVAGRAPCRRCSPMRPIRSAGRCCAHIQDAAKTLNVEIKPFMMRGQPMSSKPRLRRMANVADRRGYRAAQPSASGSWLELAIKHRLAELRAQRRVSRGRRTDGLSRTTT